MNWWRRLQVWLGGPIADEPDSKPHAPSFGAELPSRFAVPSAESTYSDFPGDISPPTEEEVKRNQEAFDPMHWDKETKK